MSEYLGLNRAVHGRIHDMTGSAEVVRAARGYWDRSDFLIASAARTNPVNDMFTVSRGHGEIAAAIDRGDTEAARRHAVEHILDACLRIRRPD